MAKYSNRIRELKFCYASQSTDRHGKHMNITTTKTIPEKKEVRICLCEGNCDCTFPEEKNTEPPVALNSISIQFNSSDISN